MRTVAMALAVILLAGCAEDAEWLPPGGGLYGRSAEVVDDEKCRELGFEPGTVDYGNCRLKLEEIRAIKAGTAATRQGNKAQGDNQGLSILCKDALARGDEGAAFIHC